MLFDSLEYLIFLPLVLGLYSLFPQRSRWMLLLAASYVFYGFWRIDYLGLMLISTLVDWYIGLRLAQSRSDLRRKIWLGVSLAANLGMLGYFKYARWIVENLNILLPPENVLGLPEVLLPVGISFYTFQTLSYTLDVYFRRVEPEKELGRFALYVSYFPQLVAGPIERFDRLSPQLKESKDLRWEDFSAGLRLILFGLVLKSTVADSLAPVVDRFYEEVGSFGSTDAAIASMFYAAQIYADFSGYSLVAIGSARLFGVELMNNFAAPYRAHSIAGFWQRWHISLSTWFRDYVYLPLGGNRARAFVWARNILIVFGLSGLWHGANWTFLIWGLGHGLLYLLERRFEPLLSKTPLALRRAGVQIGVVLLWIWFRSPDAHTALEVFARFAQQPELPRLPVDAVAVLSFLGLAVWEWTAGARRFDELIGSRPIWLRWAVYAVLIYVLIAFSRPGGADFIYFRF
jgi:D-alanyl-lipoteichoic acid acyltransferase DltB (MBOAT superfamily)